MGERFPDVDTLALFVRVCETGSISSAARAFGLTQPAATGRIRQLERRLGLSLLDRTPKGSVPTETGSAVEAWAREVVACADRLVASAATLRQAATAVALRVCASYTAAEYLLPGALMELRRRSPSVAVSLSVANSAAVLDAVLGGQCRLGFVEGGSVPRGLRHRTVAEDQLVVIAAERNPVGRRPLTPAQVVSHPLVLREPGSGTRDVFVSALEGAGVALPGTELEFGSTGAIMRAVAAGDALGVVSEWAMQSPDHSGLKVVPLRGLDLRRSLRAVWRREDAKAVADVVAAAVRAGRAPIASGR